MIKPGTVLQNRYEIIRTIGKGGMGAVYLAQDMRLGNTVALKETFFAEDLMRLAFEREARLLAGLRHPVLPRVTDHFNENEGQFLIMEYIPGEDLAELSQARSGPFAVADVLAWADQLLDALDYLHTQEMPVVHRDIKPQNMKLTSRNQIILLDFGLAKGHAAGFTQTDGRSVFGYTPAYAPLEQIQGQGTDPRSDLYSLAATLYHFLTATPPADALLRATAVLGGLPDPLRPAQEINPLVTPAVSHVLRQGLELHANQRPASAAAWRQAWQAAQRHTAEIPAPTDTAPATLLFSSAAGADTPTLRFAAPAQTPVPDSSTAATVVAATVTPVQPPVAAVNDTDYAAPAPVAAKRWPYTVGGVAAASVLGIALWANTGPQTAVDNTSVPAVVATPGVAATDANHNAPAIYNNSAANTSKPGVPASANVPPKSTNPVTPARNEKPPAEKPPANTTDKAQPASTPQPADAKPDATPAEPMRRRGILPRVRRAIANTKG